MTDDRDSHWPFPRRWTALAALVAVAALLYLLRGVLTPVFLAFLIAYICDPLVRRLERWRIPRGASIAILLVVVLGALASVVIFGAPAVVRDVGAFAQELPDKASDLWARLEPWLAKLGIAAPDTIREAVGGLDVGVSELAGSAASPAVTAMQWIVGGTASVLGAAVGILMVPVFAAYLLYDFDRLIAGIGDLIPRHTRPHVVELAREIDDVLSQFVRGQLIVMLILAVLFSVGYAALGVRLAVPIGIVAGLLSFIPYVGGAIALGLALLMCLLDWGGWGQLVGVVAVYSGIQLLEGFVITPRVVGGKVGVPAVWILLALMIGGELFGFMGVLLAVPAAAVIKVLASHAIARYRRSAFYQGQAQHAPGEDTGHPCDPEQPPPRADATRDDPAHADTSDVQKSHDNGPPGRT